MELDPKHRPEEVLFTDKDFKLTGLMFDAVFYRSGMLLDLWVISDSRPIRQNFVQALYSLPYDWTLADRDKPNIEAFETEYATLGDPALRIRLPSQIQVNAWLFESWSRDMELDIDPQEFTEENIGVLLEFMRSLGTLMSLDVFLGGKRPSSEIPYNIWKDHAYLQFVPNDDNFQVLISDDLLRHIIQTEDFVKQRRKA